MKSKYSCFLLVLMLFALLWPSQSQALINVQAIRPEIQKYPVDIGNSLVLGLLGEPTISNAARLWIRFSALGVGPGDLTYDFNEDGSVDTTDEQLMLEVFNHTFSAADMVQVTHLYMSMRKVVDVMMQEGGLTVEGAAWMMHKTLTLGFSQNDLVYNYQGAPYDFEGEPIVDIDDILVALDTISCFFTQEEADSINRLLRALEGNTLPLIQNVQPISGNEIKETRPPFRANTGDTEGLGGYELTLDGQTVDRRDIHGTTEQVGYQPAAPLAYGRHSYSLRVWDALGAETIASTDFIISRPLAPVRSRFVRRQRNSVRVL